MLKNYRENDIILNFYRSVAYRFNPEIVNHLKDLSRCRLASLKEIELFEKLEKTQKIIYLKDLGISTKWGSQTTVNIEISNNLMRNIIDISKETGIKDISFLINNYFSKVYPEPENIVELKKSNSALKAKIKEIKKFIQSI